MDAWKDKRKGSVGRTPIVLKGSAPIRSFTGCRGQLKHVFSNLAHTIARISRKQAEDGVFSRAADVKFRRLTAAYATDLVRSGVFYDDERATGAGRGFMGEGFEPFNLGGTDRPTADEGRRRVVRRSRADDRQGEQKNDHGAKLTSGAVAAQ